MTPAVLLGFNIIRLFTTTAITLKKQWDKVIYNKKITLCYNLLIHFMIAKCDLGGG